MGGVGYRAVAQWVELRWVSVYQVVLQYVASRAGGVALGVGPPGSVAVRGVKCRSQVVLHTVLSHLGGVAHGAVAPWRWCTTDFEPILSQLFLRSSPSPSSSPPLPFCVASLQGTRVITASSDKTCRLWDVDSGECLQILEGHTDEIFSCAFNYEGDFVITGSKDNTCRIWRAMTASSQPRPGYAME
eukprot:213098-Chlamydomonas_euryale.AAC.5